MGEVVARAVVWAVHKSVCGSRRSISIAVSQKLPPLPFKNSVAWNPPVTLSWCVRNPRPHLPPPPRRSDCGCCTPARLFKQVLGINLGPHAVPSYLPTPQQLTLLSFLHSSITQMPSWGRSILIMHMLIPTETSISPILVRHVDSIWENTSFLDRYIYYFKK